VLVVDDPALLTQLARPTATRSEPWFESAPAHVLVLTREADYHERYTKDDKLQAARDRLAGAVLVRRRRRRTDAVLLAAIDEGLAAGVYGVPVEDEPRWRELLGIPPTCASSPGRRSDGHSRTRSGAR
jgi:hypothetical protein